MTEGNNKLNQTGVTRRRFLQSSGIALAGLALAPNMVLAQGASTTNTGKKIRMGVVGGGFGAAFFWHLDPNCVVAAVSDLREDRRNGLKNVYKCDTAYNSLEELIKDKDIDAVAVFSGAPDHVKHAVACMKAGKNVISAVPAAMNLEDCELLVETVKKTGKTYMMAETSYYHPSMISARQFLKEGKFGNIFYTEAEYHHAGMENSLWFDGNGKSTWRHGLAPMNYPTHCTSFLVGLTGERLTEVTCIGWGDDDPVLKNNPYKNPFWNESAMFKTNKGNAFRVAVFWRGAFGGTERAQWYGNKMSMFEPNPNGLGPIIRRTGGQMEKDNAGFARAAAEYEQYQYPNWQELMLPEPLRVGNVGHEGAEPFLTHEFIDALVHGRKPTVNVYEAVAYTAPGIVAHQSALKGGVQMKVPQFG